MTASLLAASGLSSRTATAVAREVRLAADTGIAVDRLRDASNRTFEARREVARFLQMLELGNPSNGVRIVDGTGVIAGGGEHTGPDPRVIGMRGHCGVPLLGSVAQALMGSREIDIPAAPPGQ